MPPDRITTNMPRLTRPFVTIWRKRLLIFRWVKKTSEAEAAISIRMTKAAIKL
jgi:hypothetical protein